MLKRTLQSVPRSARMHPLTLPGSARTQPNFCWA